MGRQVGALYADELRDDLGVWDPIGDDDWEFNESVLYACIGVMSGQDEFVWLDEQLLRWTDYSASANEKLFDAAMQHVCPELNYQRLNEWDFHVPASFAAAHPRRSPLRRRSPPRQQRSPPRQRRYQPTTSADHHRRRDHDSDQHLRGDAAVHVRHAPALGDGAGTMQRGIPTALRQHRRQRPHGI